MKKHEREFIKKVVNAVKQFEMIKKLETYLNLKNGTEKGLIDKSNI